MDDNTPITRPDSPVAPLSGTLRDTTPAATTQPHDDSIHEDDDSSFEELEHCHNGCDGMLDPETHVCDTCLQ